MSILWVSFLKMLEQMRGLNFRLFINAGVPQNYKPHQILGVRGMAIMLSCFISLIFIFTARVVSLENEYYDVYIYVSFIIV